MSPNKLLNLSVATYFFFLASMPLSFAARGAVEEQNANFIISQLYLILNDDVRLSMAARIEKISAYFLNKPYLLGALGEGENALFDQFPRYRTDSFDCETYVTTVIALALANQLNNFTQCLNKIRYYQGQVDYLTRNHFTGSDWNNNNQNQGFIKDITTTIKDIYGQPVAQLAVALIDKPSWYQHLPSQTVRLKQDNEQEQAKRLQLLKKMGSQLPRHEEQLSYLPLTALFTEHGEPNYHLFKQIPDAAIIEIVRPNWNLSEKIGTHLNVSHLGFAFWQHDQLIFRQASSNYGKVVDVPLIDMLRQAMQSPTIKGINIQVVLPVKPLSKNCNLSH